MTTVHYQLYQLMMDGIIVIDKPANWTSHDVVARARKILKTRRIGHTGTLDPFATGALVLCINHATRLVQFLTGDDKEYLAMMRLGFCTTTGDLTGEASSPVMDASHITEDDVNEAFNHFRGLIKQIPPMYSAKKVKGVRLYEMARRGEEIERPPIDVHIKTLELTDESEAAAMPTANPTKDFTFRVVCSSGAYIRTLAEDIGKSLGVGAHLAALRRTRAGRLDLSSAVTLEDLEKIAETNQIESILSPMRDALDLDELFLNPDEYSAVIHGRPFRRPFEPLSQSMIKLCDNQRRLIAIAEYDFERKIWRPRIVFDIHSDC